MGAHSRDDIITAIQEATAHDGGKPVGRMRFETLTGITRRSWQGVYWARWSDALREAGFDPNTVTQRLDQDEMLKQAAELVRRFGRLPVEEEIRVARRSDPTLMSHSALRSIGARRDGGLVTKLRELALNDPAYADLLSFLPEPVAVDGDVVAQDIPPGLVAVTGQVYLVKMGKHYKIGHSNAAGRRTYELGIKMPERLTVVHVLDSDDPEGIEAYWHKRFEKQGKRLEGEWFALTREDVAAFKRRGRFM